MRNQSNALWETVTALSIATALGVSFLGNVAAIAAEYRITSTIPELSVSGQFEVDEETGIIQSGLFSTYASRSIDLTGVRFEGQILEGVSPSKTRFLTLPNPTASTVTVVIDLAPGDRIPLLPDNPLGIASFSTPGIIFERLPE